MKLVEYRSVPLSQIEVGSRLRVVDPDHVETLSVWIDEAGLQQPIEIWKPKGSRKFKLNAGAHRLEACRRLGWTEIDSKIVEPVGDDPEAESLMSEIVENVARHDLNALDRAANLFHLKEVWERLHPETKWGGSRKKSAGVSHEDHQVATVATRFTTAAADKTGMSERTIRRAVALHGNLSPLVRSRIAGTGIARQQSELVKLADLDAIQQAHVVEVVLDKNNDIKSVAKAVEEIEGPTPANKDAIDKAFKRLQSLFLGLPKRHRKRFVEWLQDEGEIAPTDAGGKR